MGALPMEKHWRISSRLRGSGLLSQSVTRALVWRGAWRWQEGGFTGADDEETTEVGQEG